MVIQLIYERCGTPSEEDWPGVSTLRLWQEFGPKKPFPRKIRTIFRNTPKVDELGLDLLDQMLALNPEKRISATDAINHAYFKEDPLPCKTTELPRLETEGHEFQVKKQKKLEKERATGQQPPVRQPHNPNVQYQYNQQHPRYQPQAHNHQPNLSHQNIQNETNFHNQMRLHNQNPGHQNPGHQYPGNQYPGNQNLGNQGPGKKPYVNPYQYNKQQNNQRPGINFQGVSRYGQSAAPVLAPSYMPTTIQQQQQQQQLQQQQKATNSGAAISTNPPTNPIPNPEVVSKTNSEQLGLQQIQDNQKNGNKLTGKRSNPEGVSTISAISSLFGGASHKRQHVEEDNPLEKLVNTKPEEKKDQ